MDVRLGAELGALWETMERESVLDAGARTAPVSPVLAALAEAHHAEMDHRPDDAARALQRVEATDGAIGRVAALLALRIAVRRGDGPSVERAVAEAEAIAGAATGDETPTRLRALHLDAVAAIRLGKLEDAERALGRVLEHPLPSPLRFWILDSFAQVLSGQGAWVEATRTMEALLRLRRDAGDVVGHAITAGNLARIAWETGDLEGCMAAATGALDVLGGSGSPMTRLRLQTFVTMASARPEVPASLRRKAIDDLRAAYEASAPSQHYLQAYAALALSRAAAADGDVAAAERWLDRARADVSSPGQKLLVLHHEAMLHPERLHDPRWRADFEALVALANLVGEGEMRIRIAIAESSEGDARRAALDAAYERSAQSNHPLWTHWLDDLTARLDPALHGERLARRFSGWGREELRKTRREDVTIVFSDLVSFTARTLELDPEAVMDTVRGLFEIAVPVMTRHGVSPITYMGDGLLAVARGERHEERGLSFARELVERTDRISRLRSNLGDPWPLDLRAGVASGPVVLGTLGSFLKLDFAAIGVTTNLAARLQSAAAPRELVCDERTARAAGLDLPFEEVRLKGFERHGPVRVCRLVPSAPSKSGATPQFPVLFERKGGHMAKGIERGKKDNKPKLSTKEKQKKKKEKKAAKG